MDNSIQAHQKELCNKLWAMANALRGNMEAYEFKNYILGMIFYYYLSDKTEKYMVNLLKDDNISYEDAWNDDEYKAAIVEEALRDLGYIIEPEYLFRKMVKMVENRSFDIEFLQKAINALMESTIGNDSQEDFDGLFSDMQLDSTKLGHTVKDRSAVMAKIIASLDEINFSVDDTKIDVLGNAYEYLIGQFAATAGKKAGEFYTPSGPAELLCRLACLGLTDVKDAADPTCGSGSLLLRLKNYANVRNYYGQELTSTTYNLARMNMILRGIPYRNFNIYNGDTLEHDYFGDMKFRVQVANPPYSANWSADMHFMEDERFNEYGKLAPKSKADFAFVQHMVYHMDEDGRAVVLLPHGVLFRGAAEEVIRKHLIQKLNVLDAVIGLPANLFFGTGIPVCVLVLKRERNGNSDNILFIDASNDFEAGKNQNILRECDIDKIVETYEHRVDVDKYAHVATMQEIKENGFNLNIPRYVDSSEAAEHWDVYASMFGGIPTAEIDEMSEFWTAFPALKKALFTESGIPYVNVSTPDIKSAIKSHPDVVGFENAFNAAFSTFPAFLKEELIDRMGSIEISKAETVLSADIFERLKDIPLIDKYAAFQLLDDDWTGISIDLEMLQTEGFAATKKVDPNLVIKKKDGKDQEVQEGWVGHIIPFDLVQATLLSTETDELHGLESRLAEIPSEYESILDEMTEEDKESCNDVLTELIIFNMHHCVMKICIEFFSLRIHWCYSHIFHYSDKLFIDLFDSFNECGIFLIFRYGF